MKSHAHEIAVRNRKLKSMLNSPQLGYAMEAHNGLSAAIVEATGFKAIWASGLSISSSLGMRDYNEASWSDIAASVEQMVSTTSIPVIVDGDTGHGNFNNVMFFTKKISRIGASAICIEDKIFPKINSFIENPCQQLVSEREFCGKIKAAKDSAVSRDFLVIARTEALIVGASVDVAVERAAAYYESGADAILIHSKKKDASEIKEFSRKWERRCPVIIVPTTYFSTPTKEFEDAGISIVIWANHNLRSSINAMTNICKKIYQEKTLINIEHEITPLNELFSLLKYDRIEEYEKKYT